MTPTINKHAHEIILTGLNGFFLAEVRPKTGSPSDRHHQEPLIAPRPDVSHQSATQRSIAPGPEASIIQSASQPDAAKAYIVGEIEKKKVC